MKEEDFINTHALGTVTAAINVLKEIVPENLKEVIPREEYNLVMPYLCLWQDRLFKKIETNESEQNNDG